MFQVTDDHTFQQAMEFINANATLAYDTETTGLNTRKDTVIGFGIANAVTGFYVPLHTFDNTSNKLVAGPGAPYVQRILAGLKYTNIITFNASFDLRMTKNNLGVDLLPALHCDVLLLKHTCDEDFPLSLKDIAVKVFGTSAKAEQLDLKESIKANGGSVHQYFKASTDILARYCVQDCLLTYKLYQHYSMDLARQSLVQFFYDDEVMPLYKEVTIPMEETGLALDIPLMQQTLAAITLDIASLERDIQEAIAPHTGLFQQWFLNKDYPRTTTTGKPSAWTKKFLSAKQAFEHDYPGEHMFNLLSKHHLKKLFFDTLKEKPLSKTPTGLPQVDDEFISSMHSKHPWTAKLTEYNKLIKIKSTYIERFLNESESGIFYPAFLQHRTVSGRYGGDVQQLPRPIDGSSLVAKYTNVIRSFFVARDGRQLCSADYEQLEPSVFAHVSTDAALQNIFHKGTDFYSTIAILTEGYKTMSADKSASNYLGKIDKGARQRAKSYSLGIPYGLTGYKLQYELDIPLKDADALVAQYLAAFPALKGWMDRSRVAVVDKGIIKSQGGRVRHLQQAQWLYRKHGDAITDDLKLWKKYHEYGPVYDNAKMDRRTFKNLVNNGVNFQIQSLAASIVNRAAIAINRELRIRNLNSVLVAQIHDELVYEVPEIEAAEVSALIKHVMENVMPLTVPLRTTPQFGKTYKDCK